MTDSDGLARRVPLPSFEADDIMENKKSIYETRVLVVSRFRRGPVEKTGLVCLGDGDFLSRLPRK